MELQTLSSREASVDPASVNAGQIPQRAALLVPSRLRAQVYIALGGLLLILVFSAETG